MKLRLRDRLRLAWLRPRHRWSTEWAHKPLCDRFRRDVVRLGRLHLCRSCLCLYGAALAAALTAPCWLGLPRARLVQTLAAGVAAILILGWPAWYPRLVRPLRDLVRAFQGAMPVLAVAVAALGAWLPAILAAVSLTGHWYLYFRRRPGRRRDACAGCPELGRGQVCSGFTLQAQNVRAHELALEAYLMDRGLAAKPTS